MHREGTPESDPQLREARDAILPQLAHRFHSAIRETFTTLHYPTKAGLRTANLLMEFTENKFDGEEQVRKLLEEKQKYTEDTASDTFRRKVEARLFTAKSTLWSEIARRAATQPVWQWHPPGALDKLKSDCVHRDLWRAQGKHIEKGPFPPPAATVVIQEVSRDDDTGEVKLKVRPENGDTVYWSETASPTGESQKLEGSEFVTTALMVSFVAADSSKQGTLGEVCSWRNRITIKSRDYIDGERRMVEVRSAPDAPMRFTTDGSSPRVAGRLYSGPFEIGPGVRVVQAVARKDGVESATHRRDIPAKPVDRPIDVAKQAVWTPDGGLESTTTQSSYHFIEQMRAHSAAAAGVRMVAQASNSLWCEMHLADECEVSADQVGQSVEHLRGVVPDATAIEIRAKRLRFRTGQDLLDYMRESGMSYNRDDVAP